MTSDFGFWMSKSGDDAHNQPDFGESGGDSCNQPKQGCVLGCLLVETLERRLEETLEVVKMHCLKIRQQSVGPTGTSVMMSAGIHAGASLGPTEGLLEGLLDGGLSGE